MASMKRRGQGNNQDKDITKEKRWEKWPLPSVRLAIWVGLGAVLWIGAAVMHDFWVAALLYDFLLLLIACFDLLISPQPRELEIEREAPDKMNLGVPNVVTLKARSRARFPLTLTLRDEPPAGWPVVLPVSQKEAESEAAPDQLLTRLLPGLTPPPLARLTLKLTSPRNALAGESSCTYRVTPTRRGDFVFGSLTARYGTVLGLWHRQFRREAPLSVRVYPDVSEVHRYELRLREGKLRDMGLHLLRLRGRGTEFESLRDYTRDDEYKNINWKASARRGKLISTDYEIERDQTIVIALDCGRMMTALAVINEQTAEGRRQESDGNTLNSADGLPLPAVSLSKLDCAINAAVLLAHVSASMGDAVGLLLFSDGVLKWLPPKKGRLQTGAIIEALYAAQPTLVEPDYAAAYEHLLARKMRRALVITFTDLIDPDASRELLSASGALRRHHNPLCVTINNRDVMDLAALMPQRGEELYQKAMAQKMLHQRQSALEALRHNGVGILDVEAAHLTVATVNRYLDLKSRGAL
jgi:uncharacterized protein (DUF58 family)